MKGQAETADLVLQVNPRHTTPFAVPCGEKKVAVAKAS